MGAAFAVGLVLNAGFVAAEAVWGLRAGSTALLADAGHNFGDVLALVAAFAAQRMARRPPSARFTYGLRSTTIWAALATVARWKLNTRIALSGTSSARVRAASWVATPVGQVFVLHLSAWMQPTANIMALADIVKSAP